MDNSSHAHASTHTPRLSSASSADGWVKIPSSSASSDNALTTNRYHVAIDGRFVSVIRHVDRGGRARLYCIDSICFHAGGPLALGDIEEIQDRPCLVCPWHFYSIALEDGQKYYRQATVQDGRAMAGDWQSVGVRQRTHEVDAREDGLWVRLSTWTDKNAAGEIQEEDAARGRIESDRYAFEQETGDRIWSMAKGCNGSHSSGNGCSPRITPPESPKRDRGGFCGISSESEEVWPMGTEGGDVSSPRERYHLQASPRRGEAARAPSR